MTTAYFDSVGGLTIAEPVKLENNALIKNALVLVEGTHKDNRGRIHQFPTDRVQRLVDNTNAAVATGVEIPLMADHSKELISNGELKKLGELVSRLECRVISDKDLPNSKMTHLVGKLGAFGQVAIRNRVEDVKNGLIKLLSPGIDLVNERLAEVSAVAFPAIHGPALFSLSYTEAKEQQMAIAKLKQQAQDYLGILFSVIQSVDAIDPSEMMSVNPSVLKREAVEQFTVDLLDLLGVNDEDLESQEEEVVEPPGAYDQLPAQYSQEVSEEKPLKRRRRD